MDEAAVFNSVLTYTWPDHWWIDALRVVGVTLGAIIFLWSCSRAGKVRTKLVIQRHLLYAIWGLLAMTQELQQVGEPLLVWRLPLLLVGSVLIINVMRSYAYEIPEGMVYQHPLPNEQRTKAPHS